ncbi:hypothetical protein [Roseateles noduli]|uniref:hypothetical protein n=1 Tax=Roseateles noduli TaxID=2052484 RepID=UPI003D660DE8
MPTPHVPPQPLPRADHSRQAHHASAPLTFAQRHHARLHWIQSLRHRLRGQFLLRLHVFVIALLMLGALMLGGAGLRALGVEALAWRYALLLPISYLFYLGLLRLWALALLRGDGSPLEATPDLLDLGIRLTGNLGRPTPPVPFRTGGGGNFGGGGASGDFSTSASTSLSTDLPTSLSTGFPVDLPTASPLDFSPAGDALGAAGDAVGGLDEGALVAVPVLLIVGIGAALGFCVFGLFGVEVLLAVSVELALASVAGGMAWRRLHEEGFWRCAVRRTWLPALSLVVVGVLLGAAVDRWIPAADSLPHAWQLIRLK